MRRLKDELRVNLNSTARTPHFDPPRTQFFAMSPAIIVEIEPATERIICRCLRISERQLADAASTGMVCTLRDAISKTGAGAGCTACHRRIKQFLESAE